MWRGTALIAHAASTLVPWCADAVVVGRDWDSLVRVDDAPRPGLGPLGGIAGALEQARVRGHAAVLTIGCDMPDVPAALIERLLARAPSYCSDAPILGLWPVSLAAALLERLSQALPGSKDGLLSVRRWAWDTGALPIAAGVRLANVNTPADLASA